MTFAKKTTMAAALALTASVGLALPASADQYSGHHHRVAARIASHHAMIRHQAYRAGYDRGFRDGHYAAAEGYGPGVVTGRSAYVDPAYQAAPVAGDPGLLGNGGLLGTGVLGGDGVAGTGVLDGQGALGIGVLGF